MRSLAFSLQTHKNSVTSRQSIGQKVPEGLIPEHTYNSNISSCRFRHSPYFYFTDMFKILHCCQLVTNMRVQVPGRMEIVEN